MKYEILRTDKADEQIRELAFYIAEDSGSVEFAINYLDKLERAVMNLADFSYAGTVPHYAVLKKQGFLVLIVERHLVFYKVNEKEKTVMIYAVVDGRREYKNLI